MAAQEFWFLVAGLATASALGWTGFALWGWPWWASLAAAVIAYQATCFVLGLIVMFATRKRGAPPPAA